MNLEIGQILKDLRKCHNLKQQYVASILCVSRPTYVRYELNEVETPLSKLFGLARLYQFDIVDLIRLIESNRKPSGENKNPLELKLNQSNVKGCA